MKLVVDRLYLARVVSASIERKRLAEAGFEPALHFRGTGF